MRGTIGSANYTCTRCLRAQFLPAPLPRRTQQVQWQSSSSTAAATSTSISTSEPNDSQKRSNEDETKAGGAFSRRLEQLSEESLESGGRGARKAVEEAGFSEELRLALEAKIASANFRNEFASALAQAELPASAGRATRDIAAARPWTGTESIEDASLRMLTDAYKPLRVKPKTPLPGGHVPPVQVDVGRPKAARRSAGTRLASARDKSSIYSTMKDNGMADKEREQRFKEMQERFTPHGRAVPATIQGLASLANERIEDAIARGQFKNLPRGQKIERDYNASSPFIDTTEYLLNKMIQKQDIVPPWIEKQQELVSTANKFRSRMRNDWKRHAARLIASRGGSLDYQIQLAQSYAAAEAVDNPPKETARSEPRRQSEHLSQISLAGKLEVDAASNPSPSATPLPSPLPSPPSDHDAQQQQQQQQQQPNSPTTSPTPLPAPFRDPLWESTESSYHTTAITHLNSLTRSYNLMAPDLAKKPYYSLARELKSCYAEVAPQLAEEIYQRATAPKPRGYESVGHRKGGFLERFSGSREKVVKVLDERVERRYGFREFWRDLRGGG